MYSRQIRTWQQAISVAEWEANLGQLVPARKPVLRAVTIQLLLSGLELAIDEEYSVNYKRSQKTFEVQASRGYYDPAVLPPPDGATVLIIPPEVRLAAREDRELIDDVLFLDLEALLLRGAAGAVQSANDWMGGGRSTANAVFDRINREFALPPWRSKLKFTKEEDPRGWLEARTGELYRKDELNCALIEQQSIAPEIDAPALRQLRDLTEKSREASVERERRQRGSSGGDSLIAEVSARTLFWAVPRADSSALSRLTL